MCSEVALRSLLVALVAQLILQVEHDGHGQAMVLARERDQRLARVLLNARGIDDGELAGGEALAGDEVEHLEGGRRRGLIIFIIADEPPAMVGREHLGGLKVFASEARLARAARARSSAASSTLRAPFGREAGPSLPLIPERPRVPKSKRAGLDGVLEQPMLRASSTRFAGRLVAGWGTWLALAMPARADSMTPAADLRHDAGHAAPGLAAPDSAAVSPAAGYRVESDCPALNAWNAALQARLPPHSRAEDLTRRLSIEIQRDRASRSPSYIGVIAPPGEALGPETRRVRGQSCQEVLEALALVAALGFERTASSVPGPEAAERSSAGVTASGWELSAEQALALSEDHAPPAAVLVRARGARLGLAAFVLTEAIAAPQLGWNYGLGASAHWDGAGWQPWLLFGIYAGGGERARVPEATAVARFERLSTYAVGCPVRFPRSAPVAVRPCVDLDLGRLTGEGLDVSGARRRSSLWASTGLELRFEWSPWPALELSGMLGGVLPLSRPRFYFRPQLTTLEVAPLGLRAGALANLSF
jgi:hypothetical protein